MGFKKILILTVMFAVNTIFSASDGDIVWQNNFGGNYRDYYNAAIAITDGIVAVGVARMGSFGSGDWEGFAGRGGADAIIVRYNNAGQVIWRRNFGGSGNDEFYSVVAVADGIVAAGYSAVSSFGNGDWEDVEAKGNSQFFPDPIIVKFDYDGEIVWKRNFIGAGFYSIIAVADGIVVAAGSAVIKLDNDGEIIWQEHYNIFVQPSFSSVIAVSDGIIAAGANVALRWALQDTQREPRHLPYEALIVKFSNDGEILWHRNFGKIEQCFFNSVVAVSDGIVAVGVDISIGGEGAAIIVKYNNDGDIVWNRNFGGRHTTFESVAAVADGVIVVGYAAELAFNISNDWSGVVGKGDLDAIIVKFDNDGNVVWKNNFGGKGHDRYNYITAVADGVIAVGTSTVNSFGNGDWTGFAAKGNQDVFEDAIIVKYRFENGGANSIRNPDNRNIQTSRHGILLENAIVSDFAKISVITPEQATANLRILDNLGNVVFSADGVGAGFARPENRTNGDLGGQTPPLHNAIIWNLTNNNGRFVANGAYLIIVEATGISGRRFTYSARIGVNR
ncbi:MAG: hypothetical protein FWE23_09655 [Chitinivibrionia bacterium]|nr:hypothetical protein [Chitinivibrionia bacterium]